jgi:hypothetical protein
MDTTTATALYLIDADTGCVSMGPIGYEGDHGLEREVEAHTYVFPHRRFIVGPHRRDDGDHQWRRDFATLHGLPDICMAAVVTARVGAPAAELFTADEDRCTGQVFCPDRQLRLVLWTLRDQRTRHGQPHTWWRRPVCNTHLDAVLERLIDRSLHDGSPDSPRHIGVIVPGTEVTS